MTPARLVNPLFGSATGTGGNHRGHMSQYIAKRLLASVLILFVISILVFVAVRAIPGDVCKIVLNVQDVDQAQVIGPKRARTG